MTFNIITAGQAGVAARVMENFRHINYGNALLPVNSSGVGVDSTIDLGSLSYYFRDAYIDKGYFRDAYIDNGYFSDTIGIGTSAPDQLLEIEKNQNSFTQVHIDNNTAGTGAASRLNVEADACSVQLTALSSSYTTSNQYIQDSALLEAVNSSQLGISAYGITPIVFYTNSLERMKLDYSGNLGIGASATRKVSIYEASSDACFLSFANATTGNIGTAFYLGINASEEPVFWSESAKNCLFGTNDTTVMVLDSAGRIGAGASPTQTSYQTENLGTTYYPRLMLTGSADESGDEIQLAIANDKGSAAACNSGIAFVVKNSNNEYIETAKLYCAQNGTDGSETGEFRFYTKGTGDNAAVNRVTIDSAGRIGAGASPTQTSYQTENLGATYYPRLMLTGSADESGDEIQLAIANDKGSAAACNSGIAFIVKNSASEYIETAKLYCAQNGTDGSETGEFRFYTKAAADNAATVKVSIKEDGRVGIGKPSPTSMLDIMTSDNGPVANFINTASSGLTGGIVLDISVGTPDDNTSYFLWCQDNTTQRCYIYSDGDLQNHDNSYGGISDISLKTNIRDTGNKLDDLLKVKIKNFKFKTDIDQYGDNAEERIGVIAQELEEVFPSLIKTGADGLKGVKYSVFVPILIKAIQELKKQVDDLSQKIK